MSISARPDSFELADYVGVLRRRWWIVFGVALIGLLGAAAYVVVAPRSYTAAASVYVTASAANASQLANGRTSGPVNMDNEAQIMQSTQVTAKAVADLHSPESPANLLKQVSVTVPPNTTVLNVSCDAPTARQAAACANGFANAYLDTRHATAETNLQSAATALQAKVTPLQLRTVKLQGQISRLPDNSIAKSTARADLRATTSTLSVLQGNLNSLQSALATASARSSVGYISTPAVPPATPSSPRKLLYLPSGLLAGLLIGLIGAFVTDRRDDSIHSARDLERFLDVPVLFAPPHERTAHNPGIVSSRSRAGGAFIDLAQTIATAAGDGNHAVVVSAVSPGHGGSFVAANLAATLARTRSEVILVCADLKDSLTPRVLGVGNERGLAEVLTGAATVTEVARRPSEIPRLRVITPGVNAPALASLPLDVSRVLITELLGQARYVIIEAPASSDGADTFGLAEFADAALLVTEISRTRRAEVIGTVRRLARLRTELLGAAVIPASGRPRYRAKPSLPEPTGIENGDLVPPGPAGRDRSSLGNGRPADGQPARQEYQPGQAGRDHAAPRRGVTMPRVRAGNPGEKSTQRTGRGRGDRPTGRS